MATLRAEANADPDLGDSLALIPDLLSVLAAAGQANLLAMLSSTPTPWMDAVAKVGGRSQLQNTCSRCVLTVSILSKSFVDIYGHQINMTTKLQLHSMPQDTVHTQV